MTERPGGYVPPGVGAPTWPQPGGPPIVGREVIVRVLDELFADRDQLRGVIAAAYVDLLAGRVDEATASLRAAGGRS